MPRPPAKNPRLGDRDHEILQHLLRYRLTTREILHRLFFSDSNPNAVTKVTTRLTTHAYLNRHELYDPKPYFTLGPQAARMLGVRQSSTKAYGPQALLTEYGTLTYCFASEPPRRRLLVSEIRERDPSLLQKGLESNRYYLDRDGDTMRLGFIRVDGGGPPDHIVRKCRNDLEHRYAHEAFKETIDGDRFLIGIVTAMEGKKDAIRAALRRHRWPTPFRIEVVPELIHLLPRTKDV